MPKLARHPDLALGSIRGALQELALARQWFDWVTDPRAVDEAILRLGAAELRVSRTLGPLRRGLRWPAAAGQHLPMPPVARGPASDLRRRQAQLAARIPPA